MNGKYGGVKKEKKSLTSHDTGYPTYLILHVSDNPKTLHAISY